MRAKARAKATAMGREVGKETALALASAREVQSSEVEEAVWLQLAGLLE